MSEKRPRTTLAELQQEVTALRAWTRKLRAQAEEQRRFARAELEALRGTRAELMAHPGESTAHALRAFKAGLLLTLTQKMGQIGATTMAELAVFPRNCWVLIVEPEPLQAMTLESLVDEFGCECMGPAGTLSEVEKLFHTHRPRFALVDIDIDDELAAVTSLLDREEIVYALLAVGPANAALDRSEQLRLRPRIQRPFHGPTLHAAMCGLYQTNLAKVIDRADWHLKQGQQRLARQLRRIEEIAARGEDTMQADILARAYAQQLRSIRETLSTLTQELAEFASGQEQP